MLFLNLRSNRFDEVTADIHRHLNHLVTTRTWHSPDNHPHGFQRVGHVKYDFVLIIRNLINEQLNPLVQMSRLFPNDHVVTMTMLDKIN